MNYKSLSFQVMIGILLGVMFAIIKPQFAIECKLLSDIFIKLISMLVGPIIFCTLVSGIVRHGDLKKVGKIALYAIIYFEVITTLAFIIGFIVSELIKPGMSIDTSLTVDANVSNFATSQLTFAKYIMNIFPDSIFDAFVSNNLIQILFISIIFACAMIRAQAKSEVLMQLIQQISNIIFVMLEFIVRLAPIAAFGAIAYTVSKYGPQILINFGELILVVYIAMLIFMVLVFGTVGYLFQFNIWQLLKHIKSEILLTFGTSSSEAVLPQLMQKLSDYGCNKEVVGLVVPTGYSFNLDGTAIYLSVASMFIAQAYGIELSFKQEMYFLLILMINSKGAAAVAGGGFICLAATIAATGLLPTEGLALLIGVDRLLSVARAVTNVIGNSIAAVVVDKYIKDKSCS